MAFDLLKSARHVRGLSHAEFRVLFYLLDAANNNTLKCFPSVKEIAECTEMGERTVHRHIATLVDRGFFERIEQRRRDGSRAVNCYRFKLAGTIQLGDQPPVEIVARSDPETDEEQPATNGRWSSNLPPVAPPPVTGGTTPCHPWQDISQESSQDSIPPSANAEAPPAERELFELQPEIQPTESLVAFFERRWAEIVAANDGRIAACRKVDDALKRQIELRGKEHLREGETPIDVWREVFDNIATSRFLRGLVPPGPGRDTAFKLSVSFVVRKTTFREILHGAFNRDRDPSLVDSSGRRLGPTDQALGATLQRLRASRAGGAGGGRQARLA